ncbi:uncharacterized protein IWZ02DRAFT_245754 [Phyllosticta citriasiana]|uniref:Uncharacterized protein n=1 Tax=Phyllosticta citriasiana TaxID=595635 RepID=A0ABR1KQJ3_9PEZI
MGSSLPCALGLGRLVKIASHVGRSNLLGPLACHHSHWADGVLCRAPHIPGTAPPSLTPPPRNAPSDCDLPPCPERKCKCSSDCSQPPPHRRPRSFARLPLHDDFLSKRARRRVIAAANIYPLVRLHDPVSFALRARPLAMHPVHDLFTVNCTVLPDLCVLIHHCGRTGTLTKCRHTQEGSRKQTAQQRHWSRPLPDRVAFDESQLGRDHGQLWKLATCALFFSLLALVLHEVGTSTRTIRRLELRVPWHLEFKSWPDARAWRVRTRSRSRPLRHPLSQIRSLWRPRDGILLTLWLTSEKTRP